MIRWVFGERGPTGTRPEYDPHVRKVMRAAFSTADGREALAIILADLGFFDEARNPDTGQLLDGEAAVRANALRDYARRLLEQIGVLHESNARAITDMLIDFPVWERKDHRRTHGAE